MEAKGETNMGVRFLFLKKMGWFEKLDTKRNQGMEGNELGNMVGGSFEGTSWLLWGYLASELAGAKIGGEWGK